MTFSYNSMVRFNELILKTYKLNEEIEYTKFTLTQKVSEISNGEIITYNLTANDKDGNALYTWGDMIYSDMLKKIESIYERVKK